MKELTLLKKTMTNNNNQEKQLARNNRLAQTPHAAFLCPMTPKGRSMRTLRRWGPILYPSTSSGW